MDAIGVTAAVVAGLVGDWEAGFCPLGALVVLPGLGTGVETCPGAVLLGLAGDSPLGWGVAGVAEDSALGWGLEPGALQGVSGTLEPVATPMPMRTRKPAISAPAAIPVRRRNLRRRPEASTKTG
ncbi:MAG: hypothetical protein JWN52_6227 [Actinomycetia bacterium]|nr:hypothetical protein [Actinomycetes bacterium]